MLLCSYQTDFYDVLQFQATPTNDTNNIEALEFVYPIILVHIMPWVIIIAYLGDRDKHYLLTYCVKKSDVQWPLTGVYPSYIV